MLKLNLLMGLLSQCTGMSNFPVVHFNHVTILFVKYTPKRASQVFSGKESACQCRRCGFDRWVWKITQRRKWQLTPVSLPGESCGQRSLAGHSPGGHKGLDMTQQLNNILQQNWKKKVNINAIFQKIKTTARSHDKQNTHILHKDETDGNH